METTLSLVELRRLARLYRDGVEGAGDQLADIIKESSEVLPDVVGFPRTNLERLRESSDPVELLVVTLEAGLRAAREDRGAALRRAARALAVELAACSMQEGETVRLPVRMLADVVTSWPGRGVLVFGEHGGVGVPGLRAFLRECRRIDEIDAELTPDALVIRYRTSTSRGRVRLDLHPAPETDDVVMVPLPTAAPRVEVEAAEELVARPCPSVRIPPKPASATPVARFAFRFIEAVAAVVAGAP